MCFIVQKLKNIYNVSHCSKANIYKNFKDLSQLPVPNLLLELVSCHIVSHLVDVFIFILCELVGILLFIEI